MILTPKQNTITIKHFSVSLDGSPLPLQFFTIFCKWIKNKPWKKHSLYVIPFQQQLKNWSNRSSATKNLWKKYDKVGHLGIYVKNMSERIACGFRLLHKISAGKCWQVLYLNIYIYIHTNTDIYIYKKTLCIKGQNSLMVWKLDWKRPQGRAVSCLLGWGSGGHQWGADRGAGQVTLIHPAAAELRVCYYSPSGVAVGNFSCLL